jgi:hypothetical protein
VWPQRNETSKERQKMPDNFFEIIDPETATIKNPVDYGYAAEDIEEWGPIYVDNGPVSLKRFIKEDAPNVTQKVNDMRLAFYNYIKTKNSFNIIGKPYISHPFSTTSYNQNVNIDIYQITTPTINYKKYNLIDVNNSPAFAFIRDNNSATDKSLTLSSNAQNEFLAQTPVVESKTDNLAGTETLKAKQLFKQQIINSSDLINREITSAMYPYNYSYYPNVSSSIYRFIFQFVDIDHCGSKCASNAYANANVARDNVKNLKAFRTMLWFSCFDNIGFYNTFPYNWNSVYSSELVYAAMINSIIFIKFASYDHTGTGYDNIVCPLVNTFSFRNTTDTNSLGLNEANLYINTSLGITDAEYPFPTDRKFIFPVGVNINRELNFSATMGNGAYATKVFQASSPFCLVFYVGNQTNKPIFGPVTWMYESYETIEDYEAGIPMEEPI